VERAIKDMELDNDDEKSDEEDDKLNKFFIEVEDF
jgi:hypothetical protein